MCKIIVRDNGYYPNKSLQLFISIDSAVWQCVHGNVYMHVYTYTRAPRHVSISVIDIRLLPSNTL